MMCYRQPIRNTASPKETKPRVFDALIDGDDVYLEVKNAKERELIRLRDVLAQIEVPNAALRTRTVRIPIAPPHN